MASAAEQLAANISYEAFSKAEELKKRLWFTLGALIVYRLGTYIPIPGVDPLALSQLVQENSTGILSWFNGLAGGALGRMALFALNLIPYISAAIIMQLMTTFVPYLEQLKKEGEQGRKQINQYTRYATVTLASIQSFGIAIGLENSGNVVIDPGWFFRLTTVITLVGGVVFLMWLGEQVTQRGIGNGIAIIIFSGIVAQLPSAIAAMLELGRQGIISTYLIMGITLLCAIVVTLIVFVELSQRRIIIQYPKRQVGNRMAHGTASHLPLKLNTAGVIPPIFASSLLLLPITIANFNQGGPDWMTTITALLGPGQPFFLICYVTLIVFFCFFYTAIVFNPQDTADNLKRQGAFVPGIRPGEKTADYIDYVLTRLTFGGAIYLSAICIMPEFLRQSNSNIPFYFGGTAILIVVNVTMNIVTQVQGYLIAQQYESMIKKTQIGRKTKKRRS